MSVIKIRNQTNDGWIEVPPELVPSPAGTYGSAVTAPAITVDARGRVTAAVDTPISGVPPAAHDIITSHMYTGGAALDVFGLSAANTIAKLTPSSNPGVAAKILATDASGILQLAQLGIGQAPTARWNVVSTRTSTATSSTEIGMRSAIFANPSGATTATYTAMFFYADTQMGNIANKANAVVVGVDGWAWHTAGGTLGTLIGFRTYSQLLNGAVTTIKGYTVDPHVFLFAGVVSNVYQYYASTPTVITGTVAALYGLYFENITGASSNYALYTNAGLNRFGDQLTLVGSADRIQLIVRGNGTQTTNLQEWQTSASAVVASMSVGGALRLGTTTAVASGSLLRVAGHVTPDADDASDLGTTALRWRTGYFKTSVGIGMASTPSYAIDISTGTGSDAAYIRLQSRAVFGYDGAGHIVIWDAGTTKNVYFTIGGSNRIIFNVTGDASFACGVSPQTDNAHDLGTSSLKWRDGYFGGIITVSGSGVDNTITGNLLLGGDTYWNGGAGSGLPYGACYGNDIAWSQAGAVQNTWYIVSDADMTDGSGGLNLVTHDGSGKLTVTKAGRYMVIYAATVLCSASGKHVETGIAVGGTAVSDGIQHYDTLSPSAELPVTGFGIVSLAASGYVEFAIRTTDAGTPDLTVDHLNLMVVQFGG